MTDKRYTARGYQRCYLLCTCIVSYVACITAGGGERETLIRALLPHIFKFGTNNFNNASNSQGNLSRSPSRRQGQMQRLLRQRKPGRRLQASATCQRTLHCCCCCCFSPPHMKGTLMVPLNVSSPSFDGAATTSAHHTANFASLR